MPKRKKRGITVVRNPLNFISIIHTFFFSNVVEGQLQATILHKTHERYHLRNLHRGAMLVYCGQCKIIDFSKFETVSNWKTVQNGVKKGSCTFVLYVGAFESSFNHVSRSDKFCIMTTNKIIFSYSYIIHIIFNIIFKKSKDF